MEDKVNPRGILGILTLTEETGDQYSSCRSVWLSERDRHTPQKFNLIRMKHIRRLAPEKGSFWCPTVLVLPHVLSEERHGKRNKFEQFARRRSLSNFAFLWHKKLVCVVSCKQKSLPSGQRRFVMERCSFEMCQRPSFEQKVSTLEYYFLHVHCALCFFVNVTKRLQRFFLPNIKLVYIDRCKVAPKLYSSIQVTELTSTSNISRSIIIWTKFVCVSPSPSSRIPSLSPVGPGLQPFKWKK